VRSELAAATAQVPDASQLGWRSSAEGLFETRLDELSGLLKDAIAALDLADDDLSAQLVRIQDEQNQQNDREAAHRQTEREEASVGVR
jgi:chromosome condensin MukBEF complex kleisin-like MukF subunit